MKFKEWFEDYVVNMETDAPSLPEGMWESWDGCKKEVLKLLNEIGRKAYNEGKQDF